MKKTILTPLLFSLTINIFADETVNLPPANRVSYQNIRESESRLINPSNKNEIERLYKNTKALNNLRNIINNDEINRCASKVISAIKTNLQIENESSIEQAILGLRLNDSIDDISASLLIQANKTNPLIKTPLANDDLTYDDEDSAMDIIKKNSKNLKNESLCFEDTYRGLVRELVTSNPKNIKNLKHINRLALENGLITRGLYKRIEIYRQNKVHEWPISLSEYAKTLSDISRRFPNRQKESAKLITESKKNLKKSLRQSLYERYNSTQIIILANVVKDLKSRLESTAVTININYSDRDPEIFSLSAMEKFRFILKLLRKELATLNNSSLLNGKPATYMDLIAASYEIGYISSLEIEQLASLQDIWNPAKTPKEKVLYWVKTFGGVASVILPPPYGFVSVLAIMLIDQQVSEAPVNRDSDFNLF